MPDSRCPHGNGIGINTAEWTSQAAGDGDDFPALAAAMQPNGDALVIASGAPTPTTAIAAEFRTPCDLDPTFGESGVTQLDGRGFGVSIADVIPTAGGGALVAGSTTGAVGRWLVGKLTASGQLDQAFGERGWAVLPWPGTATTMAVTPNGNILVGGFGTDNGVSFVGEITAQGSVVRSFGAGGHALMPPAHDGGVQGVWVEPAGKILALVGGGNMGCWWVQAVTLTASGRRMPGFTARVDDALKYADPGREPDLPIFVGSVSTGPDGFHLVGTGQDDCVGEPPQRKSNPSHRGIEVAFRYDGRPDPAFGATGVRSFSAPMADDCWVLPQSDTSVLLAIKPDHPVLAQHWRNDVLVYRLTSSGRLDTHYANHGVADVLLPGPTGAEALPVVWPLPVSDGRQAAVVTPTADGHAVILVPFPAR